jgi:hypothetical protein
MFSRPPPPCKHLNGDFSATYGPIGAFLVPVDQAWRARSNGTKNFGVGAATGPRDRDVICFRDPRTLNGDSSAISESIRAFVVPVDQA